MSGGPPADEDARPPRLSIRFLRVTRTLFLLLALLSATGILLREPQALADAARQLGVLRALLSTAFVAAGVLASSLAWRGCLRSLGVAPPSRQASSIFFVTQLGKYLPGGLWSIIGQMEAAERLKTNASTVALAGLVFLGLHVVTGGIVALIGLLVAAPELLLTNLWALALALVIAVLLSPPVLVKMGAHLSRRLPGSARLPELSWRGLMAPVAWLIPTWLAYGVSFALLVDPFSPILDRPADVGYLTAAFALAWVVGVLVLPAPSGIGPREAVLYLGLLSVVEPTAAVTIVTASRLTHVVADVGLGLLHSGRYARADA